MIPYKLIGNRIVFLRTKMLWRRQQNDQSIFFRIFSCTNREEATIRMKSCSIKPGKRNWGVELLKAYS
jgi:hypothetical protein